MNTKADLQCVRQDSLPTGKPGWFRAWRRFMKWSLSCCLLFGTPVLWVYAVLAYARHDGSLTVMNVQVKDLPSLLLLAFTGPAAVLIISLVLWVMFILPIQLLWWGGRWIYRATLAYRHDSRPPATGA